MIQAQTRGQVLEGVQQYGLAPGARKMIDAEEQAAQVAMETGIYGVWRNSRGADCTRIGPSARCFCNHSYAEHFFVSAKAPYPICKACSCRAFAFVPSRPEEVGEWWLPRRKGFNVHTWRAKCRCGHGHDEHDPNARRCRCGCSMFQSNFACLACDLKWEDHESVFETATERLLAGRPVGDDFRPLADDEAIRGLVFPAAGGGVPVAGPAEHGAGPVDSFAPNSLRRMQVPATRGEKAVRIMAASSGGAVADQPLANRWGKVANPPAWPPALGSAGAAGAGTIADSPRAPGSPGRGASLLSRRPGGGGGGGGGVRTGGPGVAAPTDPGRPGSSSSGTARPGSVGLRPVDAVAAAAAASGVGYATGSRSSRGEAVNPTGGVRSGGGGGGSRPSGAMAPPSSYPSSSGPQGAVAAAAPNQLKSGFRPVYD